MKRNEILGEHKKGTKAIKYNKKPKDHSAEFSKAKEKLAPVKPMEGYNPNSVGAEHRRKLDQSHAADLKARAESPDATERDQQRYQNYLDKKEQMANDYNDRMERESIEQEALYRRRGSSSAYDRDYQSSVSGMGKRQSQAYQDDGGANDERHDLDPSDWYIVKDGKMYKTSVYPRDEQEATRRGYSRTREEANAKAKSTDEAMGADMGKITKVDPTTKKATLTKPDGTSMEVDSTALKPTPDGKMSMDTPDTDELKTGTAVVSTEGSVITELDPPPNDSTSPIHGGQDCQDLRRLRELAGQPAAPADEVDPGEEILGIEATPEIKAFIDANTVRDAEGEVDLAGTLGQFMTKASAEMDVKGLQDALAQMEVKVKEFPTTPEFQAMSPEDQAEWKQAAPEAVQTMRELAAQLIKLQQTFADGGKQLTNLPKVEEAALTAMLRIAGLR